VFTNNSSFCLRVPPGKNSYRLATLGASLRCLSGVPGPSAQPEPVLNELEEIGSPHSSASTDTAPEAPQLPLDEDARDILGDVPGQDNSDPADLHPEVLRRWHHWIFQGLDKEEREYLLSLYPVVSTFLPHAF